MTGDELTNALHSTIMELTLEERAQLLDILKEKERIKGVQHGQGV